jgi:hypothetical protein
MDQVGWSYASALVADVCGNHIIGGGGWDEQVSSHIWVIFRGMATVNGAKYIR